MLVGRRRECARLDALIRVVRAGSSAAIVVRGEPGIGKTSLLEHAVARAEGLRVLRAQGAESEQNLPFVGLADLLHPILGYLDVLPGPQRTALAGALAIGPAVSADRFAICAATLSLLGAAATDLPVLMVIDDAHWLDAGSAQVVAFTAHRLRTAAIGLVVAEREGGSNTLDSAPLESIAVAGLGEAAARELLARTGREIAPFVAGQLIAGVGGNPLGLLELVATLTDAELRAEVTLPEPLPVAAALRRAFSWRLEAIEPATRRLLLLAAADAAADLGTLQRASTLLSLDVAELSAAEEAGLVQLSAERVEFTHPLLRSVVYHSAKPADRRAVHRALAESTDKGQGPIRRAWHLAAAAVGPDENLAADLDVAARMAQARSAFTSASRAYQRAAELTIDLEKKVSRLMAAGRAAHLGGDITTASRLLSQAIGSATDPCAKADAQLMRAHATLWTAPLAHYHKLISAAEAVLPFDRQRAAALIALAATLCGRTGQFDLAMATATRATELSDSAVGLPWLLSRVTLALAMILTGKRATGRQLVKEVCDHPSIGGLEPAAPLLQMLCGQALIWCEEHKAAREVLQTCVENGRALGRLADLPYGFALLADLGFRTGDWSRAYADAAEAVELSADFATRSDLCYALISVGRIEAAVGDAAQCRSHIDLALSLAKPEGLEDTIANYAAATLGLLELGAANYRRAVAELARTASLTARHGLRDPGVIQWRSDYVEGLARVGRLVDAQEQLTILDAEAATTGSQWAAMTAARCRGLLQVTPEQAIREFENANRMGAASVFEQARTRLYLGEALRRARRRCEARGPLEQAQVEFELLGARPWAERAAAELGATGMTAAPRREPVHARLTPQELRVALRVADGLSNREVASQLFVSPKTIEVHLGRIYQKLGVHTRAGLARLVNSGAVRL